MAVREGRSWTTAQVAIDPALRPGVQALSFAVLRHYGTALALRAQLAQRPPSPAADALLCSVLALALAPTAPSLPAQGVLDPNSGPSSEPCPSAQATQAEQPAQSHQSARYEAHTLVNQAVEAAKRNPATRPQANFINACLRRYLREHDALLAVALRQPQAQYNHPAWWIKQLELDYPAQWQGILTANSRAAPLTLRINTQRTSVAHYHSALAAQGMSALPVARSGLALDHSAYVPGLPGYAQGWFSVQDAAAQLAAPLLLDAAAGGTTGVTTVTTTDISNAMQDQPLRVLDACAAPGGKTAHLLEYAATRGWPVQVTALDIDAARCQRIHDNLQRLQLTAHVVAADAAQTATWWDGQPFDAILLDAPCSASGIVRRHPDIRWLRRETDIAQLGLLQQGLLEALWTVLAPGGHLLYCTCSVFRAEGYAQIQTFLAHHSEATLLPSPGHLLPQNQPGQDAMRDNHLGEHDGFFYALLHKPAPLPG